MKSAYLTSPKQIQLRDEAVPEPGAGEVLVKLKRVGICGSDVHLSLAAPGESSNILITV